MSYIIDKIKIGTRGSKLALWQANFISQLLIENNFETEIVIVQTKGDRILDTSISKIGSKGVFTEELEAKLRNGEIHIAVHSAKDLQSELAEDLEIIAFTEREKVNDVVVSLKENLPLISAGIPFTIGTSSTRRIAMLRHNYPHINTVDMRGNLQTRFHKMESGVCDALILAYAGIHRMNYDYSIKEYLATDTFTPAVGQGSIAIEISKNLDTRLANLLKTIINHNETEQCILAERNFLSRMQGGCSIPVFAFAEMENQKIKITGGILSLNGKEMVKHNLESDNSEMPGFNLAEKVLNSGGREILSEVKISLYKEEFN